MSLLKLLAMDDEDLEIVSAHMQDAVVKTADFEWRPKENRFLVAVNRFVWEEEVKGRGLKRAHERRRSILRFDRVLKVRLKGIDREKPDNVSSLLTVQFLPKQTVGGLITLLFAGEAAIQLDVECIEAQLTDLGPVWQAQSRPKHT